MDELSDEDRDLSDNLVGVSIGNQNDQGHYLLFNHYTYKIYYKKYIIDESERYEVTKILVQPKSTRRCSNPNSRIRQKIITKLQSIIKYTMSLEWIEDPNGAEFMQNNDWLPSILGTSNPSYTLFFLFNLFLFILYVSDCITNR